MNKYFVPTDEEVDKAIEILSKELILSGDTETDGLNPHVNKMWSVQLGTENEAFLFPWQAISEASRAKLRLVTKDKTTIFHNAKFDVKFLSANGFELGPIYCTQENERIIWAGKYFTFGLKDLLFRRFQIKMDKEVRETFYNGEFQQRVNEVGDLEAWDEETIAYALDDIEYLHEIYFQQQEEQAELGMKNLSWLENSLSPVVGRMENRGVAFDNKAAKKFENKVTLRRDEISTELFGLLEKSFHTSWHREWMKKMELWNSWKHTHEEIVAKTSSMKRSDNKRRKTDEALKMVEASIKQKPFSSLPKPTKEFSPNSPSAMCMALSEVTGLKITTTAKEWIDENRSLHPAIDLLAEFRKFEKLVQFCQLVENIDSKTGRIHANFKQNGAQSGRFSCADPNLQQIPARSDEAKEYRALFKARKGYKFLQADLAGIELVILAYKSGEEGLLDAINAGLDVHCFTMSILLQVPYDVLVDLKDGKDVGGRIDLFEYGKKKFLYSFKMPELLKIDDPVKWVKKFRDYVKTLTYGMAYGLTKYGLSVKFHCPVPEAEAFIALFFRAYPKLKKFNEEQEELGLERLYAVNPLGRRRWFTAPRKKTVGQIEKEVIKQLDKQKRLWESVTDEEWDFLMEEAIQEADRAYRGSFNYIRRQAANFYPQSMCADMIKLAMVKFDRDFPGDDETEGLILSIHDELLSEVRKKNVEEASKKLKEAMEYAVLKFLPGVHVDVKVNVTDVWEK